MNDQLKMGIIGNYDPKTFFSHIPTNEALNHAAQFLSKSLDFAWLPTSSLTGESRAATLKKFDALWCAPGSPYKSMNGALRAIRFAREHDWPFVGT